VESSISGGDRQRSRVGAGKWGSSTRNGESSVGGGDGQISRSPLEKGGDLPKNGGKSKRRKREEIGRKIGANRSAGKGRRSVRKWGQIRAPEKGGDRS
jgi:hypothetical protein